MEEDLNKRFVNPYNFILFRGECERSVVSTECDGYTGYFDCKIKLLTPLFIPNTSSCSRLLNTREINDEKCKKEHWKGYDFFSYDDWSAQSSCGDCPPPPKEPVIPGSELRGAVRSVYEAAFNGCMSSVSLNRVLSRRNNKPKKPGVLKQENGKWVVYPCKKAMFYIENEKIKNPSERMGIIVPEKEYEHLREGQEIWIKLKKENFIKRINTRTGIKNIPIGKVVEEYKVIENSNVTDCDIHIKELKEELVSLGYVQGWLHKGEKISGKHHESVFYDLDVSEKNAIKVSEVDIEGLQKILEEYRDPKKNRMIEKTEVWYPEYKISPKGTLVYYSGPINSHVYLSPACIGREVFSKTIATLLENNGGYEPCTGPALCPSCQVFGMIEKNGTYAYGSKVRVTDAALLSPVKDSSELFEGPVILPELGEPKPSAVEFYTKPPYATLKEMPDNGMGYWTFDYKYRFCGKKATEKIHLNSKQPELRGRKYYWHSEVELEKYKETQGNKLKAMKQRIRPMKGKGPNSEPLFCFRVYFEKMSEQELKQLKWALDFGDKDCAHKIGRAKPLGFGSVQIIIDALYLRKIDAVTGNWEMEKQDLLSLFPEPLKENEEMRIIKKMADWKHRPENVQYPSVEIKNRDSQKSRPNSGASHQWFTSNKESVSNPNFKKVLPEAKQEADRELASNIALYPFINKK